MNMEHEFGNGWKNKVVQFPAPPYFSLDSPLSLDTYHAGNRKRLSDYRAPRARSGLLLKARHFPNNRMSPKFFIETAVASVLTFDIFRNQLHKVTGRNALRIDARSLRVLRRIVNHYIWEVLFQ